MAFHIRPRRRISTIGLALALALATTACSGSSSGDQGGKAGTIRVAMVCGGMTPMTTQIAINADTFPEDLEVKKLCFDSGSEAVQALIGGSLDVFMGSTEHILSTRAQGLPTRGYAAVNNRAPYALLTAADSDIESVSDVEGETVAVTSPGSLSDTELQLAAKDGDVDYDSMKVIGAGSGSTMASAIHNGQAAAGMVSEPQRSELLQSGDYRSVWEPNFEFPSIIAVANSEWVEGNETTMRAFLSGLTSAADKSRADPSFAQAAMKKEGFPVDDKALEAAVKEGLKRIPDGLVISESTYTDTTERLSGLGLIEESDIAPFDEAFDFSYLPKGS